MRNPSFHRRGHLQRLMNTAEVVMAILQSWTGKHRQPVPKRAGMRGGGLGDKVTVDITAVGTTNPGRRLVSHVYSPVTNEPFRRTHMPATHRSLQAAGKLEKERGASIEILDLRT